MRNKLKNINCNKSSLTFLSIFTLLLIIIISVNITVVFAETIHLNPNFDKSYLNKTFSTEKVYEQVDCNEKCKIISVAGEAGSETGWCDSGKGINCCVQDLTLYRNSYDYISYCFAGDTKCFRATHAHYYYLKYYQTACYVDGSYVIRSTGWKADKSNSSAGERANSAAQLCKDDDNVKSEQSMCLALCKARNDAVRIKLGNKTIETVKDVLDTLTTEQIFYYLPHDSINYLYDPNMIYN